MDEVCQLWSSPGTECVMGAWHKAESELPRIHTSQGGRLFDYHTEQLLGFRSIDAENITGTLALKQASEVVHGPTRQVLAPVHSQFTDDLRRN